MEIEEIESRYHKKTQNEGFKNTNGPQMHKTNSNAAASSSSSSSSSSTSLSLFSSPSFSSSRRIGLHRKPNTLSTITKSIPNKSAKKVMPRSKQTIGVPTKPFSQNSKMQSAKINTKPTNKNTQRSKLSKLKKKSEAKMTNSRESGCSGELFVESNYTNSLNYYIDNCTPMGKLSSGSGLDSSSVRENSSSKTANVNSVIRTPPVEASESPEIHSQSKMLVSKSAATPVCYGAGHLLSGVTDKRKCRRRGSLKGGCEKAKLFDDDEINDVNVISTLHDSSIPLLAEASVRLVLSPCDEGREDLYSPLNSCGDVVSGLVSDDSDCRKDCSLRSLNEKFLRDNVIGEASALSLGSLSSGNIIQTPNSDSSSEGCVGRSNIHFELDSIRETLNAVGLSPKSEMTLCDGTGMDFGHTQLRENVDSVCSWVSDSTLDNLRLSQMKISWRDENDEFDCCRCLSDEEIGIDGCSDEGNIDLRSHLGTEFVGNEENDVGIDSDLCPMLVEYEPCISARGGKEKMSPNTSNNVCAESICTNGDDLVASGDSDWTYFHENHLFQIK
ncbi:hypothetical protein BUALT_Bualt14G0002400 [Buddleja alternifolia]|uniref:Uncharacterized protein n=1 Tax=Buddleja alternifolia TaxID=168488 RepID=A0AAV6WLY1_9LAMI|nr:hypothetical protein BUALT_Bualt14G0002400 [Buddleja alternifolia]